MRRDVLLAGAIALLTLTMVASATAVPGVLSEPTEDVRPSHLDLRDSYVDAHDVTGETVTLSLTSTLEHRGGAAENVTVVTRAIDADTGLVATTERQTLGDVTGERDVSFTRNLTVERDGDYRIETTVAEDGRRVSVQRRTVRNVGALTPAYARSTVAFHRFENANTPLRAISYRIVDVADNETTLNVTAYLTNSGDDQAGGLSLRVRARQADSNVVADESALRVGQIRPGRTQTASTALTVPDGYNYWLDGILRSDGVIVATESAPANLDPEETLTANETRRDVGFDSGDFAEETVEDGGMDGRAATSTAGGSGPGFTALAALVALVAATLGLVRRHP
ncbi:DUF7490 domain-containing protein [Haloarcula nitratireducens]|uniref:PGF-CTERM sorting domain-containing protein n=1 Tax=Haloarcula nitratireducens TaxID=2487749 RepID=A0AAW4P9M9_9EURY|nr:PGF-CTERM sorting domain-containing protein [Halomicroarcula nitratireducens]MBX0294230.1 PGF-CTERM sorting domain-containing protein [Halomicroarcula nitratireducens]